MRVIAGTARGRRLVAPRGERTRPTTDRVKEAWFSSLAPRLTGASVLDLFAGSGALGIEALSRGAAGATFVEAAAAAREAIHTNLEATGLADQGHVLGRDVLAALAAELPGAPFDVVVADPPYDLGADALAEILAALGPHLADDAVVTVERSVRATEPTWPGPLRHVRTRKYGDTALLTAVVDRSAAQPPDPRTRNP